MLADDGSLGPLDRRNTAAGSSSARDVLLTILGSFVLPNGGTAWTSTLIAALATAGVEERSARQAISRSAASGWLIGDKHGRRVRWRLSERAQRLLGEGAQRIYSFGQDGREWDGQWLLLFASIPELHRDVRYRLRVRLNWAGFGSMAPGVWLSPWADREAEARSIVADLGPGLAARSFVATHGALGDPTELVRSAWDLEELERSYEAFCQRHRDRHPDSDPASMAAVIDLVHHWRRFPAVDPGLPDELLPDGWPGRAAAALFEDRNRRWSPAAGSWWIELEAGSTA